MDEWALVAAALEGPDEKAVGGSWLKAATNWTNTVKARVMAPFRHGRQQPDPVMVLSDQGKWVSQLEEHVQPQVLGVVRRTYRRIIGHEPPPGFDQSQYVRQYLEASTNRMSNVPDEIYRDVARAIADGIDQGESIPNIAARVEEILTVAGSQMWTNRSVLVARTEVTGANGAGALAAGADRQRVEGTPMVKRWVATTRGPSGERTRPTHRKADGQVVPLTDTFLVGTSHMQFPGDPTAPASEVCNCRCTLVIEAAGEPATSTVSRQNARSSNG